MCLKGGMNQITYEKPQILGATIQNLVASRISLDLPLISGSDPLTCHMGPSNDIQQYTVKCHCNERQYNEMFRIAKLFSGPVPFPYLMCVKTFHFNEFRTFSITN